ncbi:MAG: hypothetical protein ACRC46_09945 [Thermoguttaceae bacterium]
MTDQSNTKIELDEYAITRSDYAKLIFRSSVKRCFWVGFCGAMALLALAILSGNWFFLTITLPILLGVIGVVCTIQCWYNVPSPKAVHLYQKRKTSFDEDQFHIKAEDGSESHLSLSHIEYADRCWRYYRLFLNKVSYVPIPTSAFRTEDDRRRFETEILAGKLKTK